MTKPYHVFAGNNFYPESGLGDYRGSHEDIEHATFNAIGRLTHDGCDWYSILQESHVGTLVEVASG